MTGRSPESIGVPGNNPYVITVGAFTDNFTPADWSDDYLAPFSASGPTKDRFVKPDVVAPGGHIVGVMPSDSYEVKNAKATMVGDQYYKMAGTSQASAVVAGIAALAISHTPQLTPDLVKQRIKYTAMTWVNPDGQAAYPIFMQGAGRVNALAAVYALVPGKANGGLNIQADLANARHYIGNTTYDSATHPIRPLATTASGLQRLRSVGRRLVLVGGDGVWSGGDMAFGGR